jgi:cobalamin biosynthesis protein CobT
LTVDIVSSLDDKNNNTMGFSFPTPASYSEEESHSSNDALEDENIIEMKDTVTSAEAIVKNERDIFDHGLVDLFMKATSLCNCSYVRKQLAFENKQEKRLNESAVNRVWKKLDKSLEVEVYRQMLFDESSVCVPGEDEPAFSADTTLPAHFLLCGGDEDGTISLPELQRTNS